jgi:Zn-dependent peptidase ImmA (M78 family)
MDRLVVVGSVVVVGLLIASTVLFATSTSTSLKKIQQKLRVLADEMGYEDYQFEVKKSSKSSYTENFSIIHLVEEGFDESTVMWVACHELTHVLTKDLDHGRQFRYIEDMLITLAKRKNWIVGRFDTSYPHNGCK